MPRRRSGGGKDKNGAPKKSFKTKKSDASVHRWNSVDDIPLDEVDQFHAGRDRILLEGEDETFDDGDEEEVFGLKGLDQDDDDDDDDVDMDGFEDEDGEAEEAAASAKSKSKKAEKKSKGKKKTKGELSSDEEEDAPQEEEETWGSGKAAYYNGNDDELESDDEEGHELELQEAKRLQAKAREDMTDDDFGLNDIHEVQKDDVDVALEEPTQAPKVALPTDPKELLRHLEKTCPEAVALARDWEDMPELLARTQANIAKVEQEKPDYPHLGTLHLYYQILLSYSTLLAFYLHLRASEKYAEKPSLLQAHPIMHRLLYLKQSLSTLEDLGQDEIELDESGSDEDFFDDEDGVDWADFAAEQEELKRMLKEQARMDEMMEEDMAAYGAASSSTASSSSSSKSSSNKRKKDKKSRTKSKGLNVTEASTEDSKPQSKKKRKVKADAAAAAPVFDLEEPEWEPTSTKSSSRTAKDADDTFGEASHLQHADAEDKSARRKTLRFHTSKIETASARRSGARNQAVGGDDDIPYRERQKAKELRLEQEARMRLAKQGGADLDDVEPEAPPEKRKREESDDGSDDGSDDAGDYYNLIKKKSKEKKVKKQEEYDAARAAEKPVYTEEATDGPRSLTRAIMKNRGLTPHRSKAVRNPRVKKRQKFEQAKKKVSSQKAIYKGGLSESGGKYGGEKSGISKVIKSVRL